MSTLSPAGMTQALPLSCEVEPDLEPLLREECTGFGLSLVSRNYEFASIVVVGDEEFWSTAIEWKVL